MRIAAAMTPGPFCLHPESTLLEARSAAAAQGVRHLPVTDADGRLVGMVSDRDLRSALPSTLPDPAGGADRIERLGAVRVESLMSRPAIALPREATLDDALLLFDRHRIGALPVVDHDGVPVGIVTVRDVLAAYRRLFGIGVAGSSLVEVPDDGRPNLLTRIVAALEGRGIVCTRLIREDAVPGGAAKVYARLQTYNVHAVHQALREAGLEAAPGAPGAAAP